MPWGQGRDPRRAKRIIRRDNGICHVCGKPGANQADHITPLAEGGTEDDHNLAAIHARPCHLRKTLAEAARGRARKSRRRPPEQHPGLT